MRTRARKAAVADRVETPAETLVRLDLRRKPETMLRRLETGMARAAQYGHGVEILWPRDRDLQLMRGTNLESLVVTLAETHCIPVRILTRGSVIQGFLSLKPSALVRFCFYVNSEEAAMRWERDEAMPCRRIAAALRTRSAGWDTQIVVGPVRLFDNWKDDYRDLSDELKAAGFDQFEICFAGEDPFQERGDSQGLKPVLTGRSLRFTVPPEKRQAVCNALAGRLADAA